MGWNQFLDIFLKFISLSLILECLEITSTLDKERKGYGILDGLGYFLGYGIFLLHFFTFYDFLSVKIMFRAKKSKCFQYIPYMMKEKISFERKNKFRPSRAVVTQYFCHA
jgi:hypothetical protein